VHFIGAGHRKVAKPWLDSQCCSACWLYPWEKRLMLFPILGPSIVYTLCWPSLTKDMQTEQLLCWSGMTDIEHSITFGSNEEGGQ